MTLRNDGTHPTKTISYTDKLNEMKILRIIGLIGWGCLTALSLQAQKKVPHNFRYAAEASEEGSLKELTQVSHSGTNSIRLFFEDVQLGPNSYLLLKGSDGAEQKLNAEALQHWSNSSAYFNGQSVKVSLYQAAGEEVVVKLKELKVNERATNPNANAVTTTTVTTAQARTQANQDLPSWAAAVGRFTDGVEAKGTGWIAANGAIVTDWGYSGPDLGLDDDFDYEDYDIIEFNVPLSNPNGSINHSNPEDQYPINKNNHFWRVIEGRENLTGQSLGYIRIKFYRVSLLWKALEQAGYTIIEALPNSTGKRPGERIGEYLQVLKHNTGPYTEGMTFDILHYGSIDGEEESQTLQKVSVTAENQRSFVRSISDKDRFLVYNTAIPSVWDEQIKRRPNCISRWQRSSRYT